MGVRITDAETVALYDSVSGFAFGPTFGSDAEAQSYLRWLEEHYEDDPRRLNDGQLTLALVDWQDATGRCRVCEELLAELVDVVDSTVHAYCAESAPTLKVVEK